MSTAWRPVVGTAVLYPAGEWLREAFGGQVPRLDIFFCGSLVIICCLTFPAGIVGSIGRRLAREGNGPASGPQPR